MLQTILQRALDGRDLTRREVRYLLALEDDRDLAELFRTAGKLRARHFGKAIFFYGFVYFSTYCRNDCTFCHYRASSSRLPRYRQSPEDVLASAIGLAESGVHLIDLTMGEDPHYYRNSGAGFGELALLIQKIKIETGLPVMVSPGAAPDHALARMKDAGADWFACYQETYSREWFDRLRQGQDYDRRMQVKHSARRHGLLVEEGLLAGVGQSVDDLAGAIIAMRDNDFAQVRVMTYVPGPDTSIPADARFGSRDEVTAIAVMRLAMPDRLIPASLDVDGLDGLEARLLAGANVVTSLVPPGRGLAGVANDQLDIEDSRRTPGAVEPILEKLGLRPADQEEYDRWIRSRRAGHEKDTTIGSVASPSMQ